MDEPTTRDFRAEADNVTLLPFSANHLPDALKLSQELGWPYRMEDWAFTLRLGHGFVLEQSRQVIGTAAWFPYGDTHATAGLIIVASSAQGRGYGAKLMDRLLEAARPRSILLNSTPEGQKLYQRRAFQAVGQVNQHQGTVSTRPAILAGAIVRLMRQADLEAMTHLDREASGMERGLLLEQLLQAGETQVLVHDGELAGYVISRTFGRGHVVGPVVARSAAHARRLIEAALARLDGCFVRIDTPGELALTPWLEEIGLPKVSEALTMILGTLPSTGPSRIFALSNQSLN